MVRKEDMLRALDWAWEKSQQEGRPLREILREAEDGAFASHSAGSIQSVSTGALSTTYAFGTGGTLTSVALQRMWRKLIEMLDAATAANPELTEADKVMRIMTFIRLAKFNERLVDGRTVF